VGYRCLHGAANGLRGAEQSPVYGTGIEENKTFSLERPCRKAHGPKPTIAALFPVHSGQVEGLYNVLRHAEDSPLAEECPVNMECRLFKLLNWREHLLYIAKLLRSMPIPHASEASPDTAKSDPIVYSQAGYWHVGKPAGRLSRQAGIQKEVRTGFFPAIVFRSRFTRARFYSCRHACQNNTGSGNYLAGVTTSLRV